MPTTQFPLRPRHKHIDPSNPTENHKPLPNPKISLLPRIPPFRRHTLDVSSLSSHPLKTSTILLWSNKNQKWHPTSLSNICPKKYSITPFLCNPIEDRAAVTKGLMVWNWVDAAARVWSRGRA